MHDLVSDEWIAAVATDAEALAEAGKLQISLSFRARGLGASDVSVVSVHGRESVSKCYRFDVSLAVASSVDAASLEQLLIGQSAAVTILNGGAQFATHGVISNFRVGSARYIDDRWDLRLRLVPRLGLLRRRKNSRIFQNQTVRDIVDSVLDDAGVQRRWDLQKKYARREYCVQYDETDYEFVTRLLAEAGISFYFEQPTADDVIASAAVSLVSRLVGSAGTDQQPIAPETVVFCDGTSAFPAIDGGDGVAGAATAVVSAGLSGGIGAAVSAGVSALLRQAAPSLGGKSNSPTLFFHEDNATVRIDDQYITRFDLDRNLRSKSTAYRAHDANSPSRVIQSNASTDASASVGVADALGASASVKLNVAGVSFDASASFGPSGPSLGARASAAPTMPPPLPPERFEVYEHRDDVAESTWLVDRNEARLLLTQLRQRAWSARGRSGSCHLVAGRRFTLDQHPRASLNQEYLVTTIEHSVTSPAWFADSSDVERTAEPYTNRFEAVPTTTNVAPKRPARRAVQVCETATVVGPAGEEIHVDSLGRIRVQFHWDRLGANNDRSSCWIRALSPWAGPQFGAQFVPRVGTEVVVAFEGGDVDRPIVLGGVYHQTSLTPFELPSHKTRSGFRTRSSPGGDGYNELSFEDAAGGEQVFLHAQRDLDEAVEHDRSLRVGHDHNVTIGNNRTEVIRGDLAETVNGNHTASFDHDSRATIGGDRTLDVTGDSGLAITGDHTVTIDGAERRVVGAAVEHVLGDDHTVRIAGSLTTAVGRHDAQRSHFMHVDGVSQLVATDAIDISSDKSITLRCGKSLLRLGPDRVEIVAPSVVATGAGGGLSLEDKKLVLYANDSVQVFAKGVLLKADQSTIAMSSKVAVDGTAILLGSPTDASNEVKSDTPTPTKISLAGQDGKPLAYQHFKLIMDDGSERSGITDGEGKAEVRVKGNVNITFPELGNFDRQ